MLEELPCCLSGKGTFLYFQRCTDALVNKNCTLELQDIVKKRNHTAIFLRDTAMAI